MPRGIRPTQDKVRKAVVDILGDVRGLSFLDLYAGSGAIGLEALSLGAGRVVFVDNNKDCIRSIKDSLSVLRPCLGLEPADQAGNTIPEVALQKRLYLYDLSCRISGIDAKQAIEQISRRKERFDIVFLDPPYYPSRAHSQSFVSSMHRGNNVNCFLRKQDSAIWLPAQRKHPASARRLGRVLAGSAAESMAKKTLNFISRCDIVAPNGLVVCQHSKKDILPEQLEQFRLIKQTKYGDTLLTIYR